MPLTELPAFEVVGKLPHPVELRSEAIDVHRLGHEAAHPDLAQGRFDFCSARIEHVFLEIEVLSAPSPALEGGNKVGELSVGD